VLAGNYESTVRWERDPLKVGNPVAPPTPLFAKLDTSVVEEELARMGGE
jgi:methionyl-tRNA synthetase